jgi:uncharacterized membrane protein YkvI
MSLVRSGNLTLFIKVALVYVGAIIGAGFASGQEIMQFFIVYGYKGLFGVALAAISFIYLGAVIMILATGLGTASYKDLLKYLLGKRLGRLMDYLNLFILAGGLVVMLAGSGAVFAQQLGLSYFFGSALAAAMTCIVITGGLQGVLSANLILVPVKLFILTGVCAGAFFLQGGIDPLQAVSMPEGKITASWEWSSILYVSYNMICPVAVLSSLGRTVPPGTGIAGGMLGGLLLGVAAALVTTAGLACYPEITSYEIPLLLIAEYLGFALQSLLGLLIWVAILTTAIANAHGLASRLAPEGGPRYKIAGVGITIAALPFAGLNFSKLVQFLYPLFGYVGLVLLVALLLAPFKKYLLKIFLNCFHR